MPPQSADQAGFRPIGVLSRLRRCGPDDVVVSRPCLTLCESNAHVSDRMIARIEIHRIADVYEYRVLADGEMLFDDAGFTSVVHCLAGAVEGLPPEVRAVEVACGGIVSGTYPLTVLAANADQIAQHAVKTAAAVFEALPR